MPRPLAFALCALPAFALPVLALTPAVSAQEEPLGPSSEATIAQLKVCRSIAEAEARLACYDREVGSIITATEQGTLQVVDRKDVEETKRGLFGFTLPKIKLFGGEDDELTELETTVVSVRREGREGWVFTTSEGSVWRILETRMGWRPPRPGLAVLLKRAAMGTVFIRIDGQIGVKGKRIE